MQQLQLRPLARCWKMVRYKFISRVFGYFDDYNYNWSLLRFFFGFGAGIRHKPAIIEFFCCHIYCLSGSNVLMFAASIKYYVY